MFYPKDDWLIETVEQVYERTNGSGFPVGLEGEQIREEAQILGIVDVFEACIHDRPYRKALTGYQLLEELTRGDTKTFSDHIIKALVRSFSLYPYNEYVRLNTDELGQVVDINPQKLSRPVIKILYDKKGKSFRRTQSNRPGPAPFAVHFQGRDLPRPALVSRSINTVTFVASATASSSRSDNDTDVSDIVEEERQRNRCRPAVTLWADGGCGRPLWCSSSPMFLHRLLLAP